MRQHTTPLILNGPPDRNNVHPLEKVNLNLSPSSQKLYDEDWIQNLIHNNPSILPIEELEPAFFPLYPVCRELKTPAGYLDNLFVSANGSLTFIECKLWRNPESRREVVGQALDYAKEFANWQYEDLSQAIKETTSKADNLLFETVATEVNDLDEATFVDAVSRNLKRGRFLILIVGDGIREGVENISNFLQKHAGLDFTFGLIELGIFKVPTQEQYIIQPRVLARTYTVERAVIRTKNLDVEIESPKDTQLINHKSVGRRTSLSEEQFFENIAQINSNISEKLLLLVSNLEDLNIYPDYGVSSLNLKWSPDGNIKINFASILKTGLVDTSVTNWYLQKLNKVRIGHDYQKKLASIIPNGYVREHDNPGHWEVHKSNKRITVSDLLTGQTQLLQVIDATQKEIMKELNTTSEQ